MCAQHCARLSPTMVPPASWELKDTSPINFQRSNYTCGKSAGSQYPIGPVTPGESDRSHIDAGSDNSKHR